MRGLVSALAGRGRCCLTVAPRTSALRPVHLDGCTLPLVGGQGDGARSAHSGAGRWHTTADTSAQALTTVSAAGSVARLGATARCSLHAGGSTGAGRLVGDSAGAHNRARVRWAHASAVALPHVDEVLTELARIKLSAPSSAERPMTWDDEISTMSMSTTSERAVTVAEEASALQEMRETVMQMLAMKGGEGWPTESAHAHHINRVLEVIGGSEPGGDAVLPRAQSAELRQIFEALPREELLDSEIFTPIELARSLQRTAGAVEEAAQADSAAVDEGTLSSFGDAVARMKSHGLEQRSDILALKAMVMKLPASQRLHFMYPLGGIDVDKFVACVLPFATSSGVLVDAAHAIVGGGDDAELSSEAAEALVSAWEACPELVREIMPATSLLAHTCQNNMMGREVQTILDGLSLERDWKISGYDFHGSLVRSEVQNLLDQGAFVRTLPRDDEGRLVSDKDRAAVSKLRDLLPTWMREQFETADDLARTLDEVYAVVETKRKPHPEADRQYLQWMDIYGEDAMVPLHKAHAFFVHGEPLASDYEVKHERAYRFPNPLHKPETSDLTAPPRQGQLFAASVDRDSDMDKERRLLQSSPAIFTGRVVFHEVLIWLERMQDELDKAAQAPPAPREGERQDDFLARSREHYARVAAGEEAPLPAWGTREEMSVVVGGQLSILEHRTLHQMLTAMWRHPLGGLVHRDIMMFARRSADERVEEKRSKVDRHGLVRALGRRKDAQAKATLAPGEGIITVNGAPLSKYFCRMVDRHEVIKPLLLTGLVSSVNVNCSTRGGGNTGQAGACRLAIARAIADRHPEKRAILKKATFLKRDPRMVERKKPGQKKARKKFQWVKR